jgi:hypothetical protein
MIRPGCKQLSPETVLEIFHSLESLDTISKRYGICEQQVSRIKRANGQPIIIFGDSLMAGGK